MILVYLLCLWLTNSRFGKVLMSVREDERRLSFIGYNPARFKIAVYALSGMLAGLSGMLFVPFNGMISPTELGISLSTMVLIWIRRRRQGKPHRRNARNRSYQLAPDAVV